MKHKNKNDSIDRDAELEKLRLLCAVDRARLRLVWRMPSQPKPKSSASPLDRIPMLGAILPFVPGPIGRWSKRIGIGASLVRMVMRSTAR